MKFSTVLLLSSFMVGSFSFDMQAKCYEKVGVPKRLKRSVRTRPHIAVPSELPGIVSLFAFRPDTAKPLSELAQILLVNRSSLSRGERELIASYVSSLNQCNFCCNSHSAVAERLLEGGAQVVQAVKDDLASAPISEKMRALLAIAGKVQSDARTVSDEDVARARELGATDLEIHDTVLIAAAFCMYNRYVDGLASFTPTDEAVYAAIGERLAANGYINAGQPASR